MIRPWIWLCAALVVGVAVSQAAAQQQASAVQLPTYSFFGTGTTVTVPDRGSVYLGGVNRAATGMNEFGVPLLPFAPFHNRAFGTETSAAGTSVSVYIHDFDAMDEALLGQSAASGGLAYENRGVAPRGVAPRQPNAWQPPLALGAGDTASQPAVGVEQLRAQHQADQQSWKKDAAFYLERGRLAEQSGKLGVARIYYQMAERRADGTMKAEIQARLAAVNAAAAPAKLAQGGQ